MPVVVRLLHHALIEKREAGMTSVIAPYIAANEQFIDENSAAALSSIPDAAWPAILRAADEINMGATLPGIETTVVKTHETIADFDASRSVHWVERGSRAEFEFGGFRAVKYERFQLHRGAPRQSQIVVDLGDFRIAMH